MVFFLALPEEDEEDEEEMDDRSESLPPSLAGVRGGGLAAPALDGFSCTHKEGPRQDTGRESHEPATSGRQSPPSASLRAL